MNSTDKNESRLWRLIEKGKLADLSQFHQQGYFDEVPLYSRDSDVDFLPDDESGNEVLLAFALKFLKSVVAYEQHRAGYFAAITVWDFSDNRVVPNLFVWCNPVQELVEKLTLRTVTTSFGKQIKKLVPKHQFSIREDAQTSPDTMRVFIAPIVRPYQGFATMDRFRSAALNSK